jgi:hypothetical protein
LPVLPPEDSKPAGAVEPSAAILALLAGHVALPFLALAATGPLVQAWFARRYPSRSPYPLYAVSNLGSFLALLAYPFALEPRLAVSTTGRLWSLGFLATAVAVIACGGVARRGAPGRRSAAAVGPAPDRPGAARLALWLLLPACGVVLMMGVTNALCLDVAGVPFLWILPLGVYLATFVLCFGSERSHRRLPYLVLAAVALALVWFSGLEDLGALALVKSIQESSSAPSRRGSSTTITSSRSGSRCRACSCSPPARRTPAAGSAPEPRANAGPSRWHSRRSSRPWRRRGSCAGRRTWCTRSAASSAC